MSLARPIFANVTLMITRRVRGRTFLLRPSKRTNQIVRYVLAVMVRTWGVRLHAVVAMSNHWHVVATDPWGNTVEFQRDCHAFIARAVNAAHGEFESLWAPAPGSRVECEEPGDVVGKIAYTMANPVEAGLVRYGHSWPGVRHAWPCKPQVIRKPRHLFRGRDEGGSWPDTAVLEFSRPPGYEELSDDELAAVIRAAIDAREERFRRERGSVKKFVYGERSLRTERPICRRNKKPRANPSSEGWPKARSGGFRQRPSTRFWSRATPTTSRARTG